MIVKISASGDPQWRTWNIWHPWRILPLSPRRAGDAVLVEWVAPSSLRKGLRISLCKVAKMQNSVSLLQCVLLITQ